MNPQLPSSRLCSIVMAAGLLICLAAINFTISAREALLLRGRVVLLRLAPVDPRSIMQGDYMALRFELARAIADKAGATDGRVVLKVAADNTATFARLDAGGALAADEQLLEFKMRQRVPRIVTDAYFFEEGSRSRFDAARYGLLRVDRDGKALLTHLADGDRKVIPQGVGALQ